MNLFGARCERANYQLFLSELCDLIGVPRPDPTVADDSRNVYVFERAVHFHNGDGTTSTVKMLAWLGRRTVTVLTSIAARLAQSVIL